MEVRVDVQPQLLVACVDCKWEREHNEKKEFNIQYIVLVVLLAVIQVDQ